MNVCMYVTKNMKNKQKEWHPATKTFLKNIAQTYYLKILFVLSVINGKTHLIYYTYSYITEQYSTCGILL